MRALFYVYSLVVFIWGTAAFGQVTMHTTRLEAPAYEGGILLYPDDAVKTAAYPEIWSHQKGSFGPVEIDTITARNVTQPTITPVLPDPAIATGAAVIVAPGGGFMSLSMDTEGFDVAHWLADHGIAAFVLKYRLTETPDNEDEFQAVLHKMFSSVSTERLAMPPVHEDGLAALQLIRSRAEEWHVDPTKVGMIGFSAGAMTALQTVFHAEAETQPNFMGYIYGPMPAIEVPASAPPMFAALALDDGLFKKQGFGIVESWRAAGKAVEFHGYERGEHGFGGLGRSGTTSTLLLPQFHAWLKMHGFVSAK